MKKFKEEKGITLVALIITIVVLLILAGVAIGTLQESNIIGRAKDAASSYEEGKNNESAMLSSAEELLKDLTSEDLTERLRIALEKAIFLNDYTELTVILEEHNMTINDFEGIMYISNIDSYYADNENPIVTIIGLGNKIYDYYADIQNKNLTVLESSHKDYATVQQFKKDIVEVRNTFLNKNLEDFEQEKVDDRTWKIKGINMLGKTEITVDYIPYLSENARSYILIDYSEESYIELKPETEFTENNNKLSGKVLVVRQNDK